MCVDHIFIRMSGRCAEINLAQILRYVGGFCGAVVTGISLFMLIAFSYSFSQTKQVIALIYCVFLGLMIVIAEIRIEMFLKWFAFLSRPVGLGLFYFFVGGTTHSHPQHQRHYHYHYHHRQHQHPFPAALNGLVWLFVLCCCDRRFGAGKQYVTTHDIHEDSPVIWLVAVRLTAMLVVVMWWCVVDWWEIVIGCVMCVIGIVYVLLGVCCQVSFRSRRDQSLPRPPIPVLIALCVWVV